jgi:hypothetical protein
VGLSGNTDFAGAIPVPQHTHSFAGTTNAFKVQSDGTSNTTSTTYTTSTFSSPLYNQGADSTHQSTAVHNHTLTLPQVAITPAGTIANTGVSAPIFNQAAVFYLIYLGGLA